MDVTEHSQAGSVDQAVIITRVFDAPRELVFDAFTDPEMVRQWWGPAGFVCPFCTIDLRIGGSMLTCMRSPEGQDFWSRGTFLEIIRPERIVYTDSFTDTQGNVVPASYYGLEGDWPQDTLVSIILESSQGQTILTLKHQGIPAGEQADNCEEGWQQSLDKLEQYLEEAY